MNKKKITLFLASAMLFSTGCHSRYQEIAPEFATTETEAVLSESEQEIAKWNQMAEKFYESSLTGISVLEASGYFFCASSENAVFSSLEAYEKKTDAKEMLLRQLRADYDWVDCYVWAVECDGSGFVKRVYLAETADSTIVGVYPNPMQGEIAGGIASFLQAPAP